MFDLLSQTIDSKAVSAIWRNHWMTKHVMYSKITIIRGNEIIRVILLWIILFIWRHSHIKYNSTNNNLRHHVNKSSISFNTTNTWDQKFVNREVNSLCHHLYIFPRWTSAKFILLHIIILVIFDIKWHSKREFFLKRFPFPRTIIHFKKCALRWLDIVKFVEVTFCVKQMGPLFVSILWW